MLDGSGYGRKGLLPLHRFIHISESIDAKLPADSFNGAIEGLLDPEPTSWIDHKVPMWRDIVNDFTSDALSYNTDNLLLKVDLIECVDDAFVFDREILGIDDYLNNRADRVGSLQKYWNSKQSVFDYDDSFGLPLVAVFNDIDPSRLEIIEKISPGVLKRKFVDSNYVDRVPNEIDISDIF